MGYRLWGVPGWVVFGVLYSKFLVRGMMNTEHRTPNVEVLVISLGHPGACAGKYAANTPFTQYPSPFLRHILPLADKYKQDFCRRRPDQFGPR